MATDINTLKSWFETGDKPTQEQFWAWMDSYWHKGDSIPIQSVVGLNDLIAGKADSSQLQYYALKDASNIDVNVWKVKLLPSNIATVDKEDLTGNVYDKSQCDKLFYKRLTDPENGKSYALGLDGTPKEITGINSISSLTEDITVDDNDPKNPKINIPENTFWKVGGNPNATYSPDGRILSYIGGLNETRLGVVDLEKLNERLKDNPRIKAIDDSIASIQIKFQQLYDDFSSGKITQAEFEQKQNELNNEYGELNKQRTTVFNEEAAKLKDIEGIQVLKVDSNQATFFKSVNTTNGVQSAYYSDKISIWETRLGFYENGRYRYGYDGSEFIQHLKDINTTVRISSYQTMGNAPYSKDVVARYPNGTIAFLSSALDSSLKKFVSAQYSSFTPYFATDKIPVFTNLKNADGDHTFDKQLVIDANGIVGESIIQKRIKSYAFRENQASNINSSLGDYVTVMKTSEKVIHNIDCDLNDEYTIRTSVFDGFGAYFPAIKPSPGKIMVSISKAGESLVNTVDLEPNKLYKIINSTGKKLILFEIY